MHSTTFGIGLRLVNKAWRFPFLIPQSPPRLGTTRRSSPFWSVSTTTPTHSRRLAISSYTSVKVKRAFLRTLPGLNAFSMRPERRILGPTTSRSPLSRTASDPPLRFRYSSNSPSLLIITATSNSSSNLTAVPDPLPLGPRRRLPPETRCRLALLRLEPLLLTLPSAPLQHLLSFVGIVASKVTVYAAALTITGFAVALYSRILAQLLPPVLAQILPRLLTRFLPQLPRHLHLPHLLRPRRLPPASKRLGASQAWIRVILMMRILRRRILIS